MEIEISSPQSERYKRALRLRERRGRQQQQRIIIDGAREVLLALEMAIPIQELFVCRSYLESDSALEVERRAIELDLQLVSIPPLLFDRLAYGDRADGVIGVASRPVCELAEFQPGAESVVIVIESVEKPGNLGAVLRTADATGVDAVIVADSRTDVFNPNAIRASLGAVFTVPCFLASSRESVAWLQKHGFQIGTARPEAGQSFYQLEFADRIALVLGSEAHGLSAVWQGEKVDPFSLPMVGRVDSLNVSVTAAVLLYELVRRRALED